MRRFLSFLLRASMRGMERGPHITRYAMYQELARFRQSPPTGAQVLSISRSTGLCEILGLLRDDLPLTRADYPAVNILDLPYPDNHFDYAVSDQVLEHVEGNPWRAVAETLRVLKPGGMVCHTTCLMNPVHGSPKDFWRFTPDALQLMHADASEILVVGGWGNRGVWLVDWLGMRWYGTPECKWHPLHKLALLNNAEWPLVTWILARK